MNEPAGLSRTQWGTLYEHTIAGEYRDWLTSWLRAHPDDAPRFRHRLLAGDERAPVGITAGPAGHLINDTIGLGFGLDGPTEVTDEQFAAVEATFNATGADGHVEVGANAHPSLLVHLARAGYTLTNLLNCWSAEIDACDLAPRDGEIACRLIDKTDPDELERAAHAIACGMSGSDGTPTQRRLDMSRMVAGCPRVATFIAEADGRIAGGSSIGIWPDHPLMPLHANLVHGATLPWARRRGVQGALMRARLRWAREQGSRTANLDCLPGVPTNRNAERTGFWLLYTKSVLNRPHPARAVSRSE